MRPEMAEQEPESINVENMEWLSSIFVEHSVIQAVVVVGLISAIGLQPVILGFRLIRKC